MNREIKFRSYNKSFREMYYYTLADCRTDGRHAEFSNNIMQYTGLKDKNGKEIYEGDIVRNYFKKYDFDKPDGEEEYIVEKISEIEFRNHGFWVKDEDFGYEGEDLWDWETMEIIGNIYENPELLK